MFCHQTTKLYAAISALQPQNSKFLDVKIVQPLFDLIDHTNVEAEFDVAKTNIAKLNMIKDRADNNQIPF